MASLHAAGRRIAPTYLVGSADIARSLDLRAPAPDGEIVDGALQSWRRGSSPTMIAPSRGPTDDELAGTLTARNSKAASSFSNIGVTDIHEVCGYWTVKGAGPNPPTDRGGELRCHLRDRDGHLIGVGQSTRGWLTEPGLAGGTRVVS